MSGCIATGSARIPALQTGVFSYRPSTDSISSNDLVKALAEMDTLGFLGRDVEILPDVFRVLHSSTAKQDDQITGSGDALEILYPTDFTPQDNPGQPRAMESFLDKIKKATGVPW